MIFIIFSFLLIPASLIDAYPKRQTGEDGDSIKGRIAN
jgi:hypothetical protein